jgi:VirE N-terminal domain
MSTFSYYKKPIKNKTPDRSVTLEELFEIVKTEFETETKFYRIDKDKKVKVKTFDYVTFHGTFRTRADNALVELSGLFVADLDHLPDIAATREELINDKEFQPTFIFTSPGGDGLKVVYKISDEGVNLNAKSRRMGRVRDTLDAHYKTNYAVKVTPDHSGSDISRACFLCYDPEAYYNPDAEVIELIEPVKRVVGCRDEEGVMSLEDFAKKYLKEEENRTDDLIRFIGGVKAKNIKEADALAFIQSKVKIAADSSKADPEALAELVRDQYERYPFTSKGIVPLTFNEFGIGLFKYAKKTQRTPFIISSLYHVGVTDFLKAKGFYKFMLPNNSSVFVFKEGCIITETNVEQMRDAVRNEIEAMGELKFMHMGGPRHETQETLREVYLTHHRDIFIDKYLQNLPALENMKLRDSSQFTFFIFRNGVVCAPHYWVYDQLSDKMEASSEPVLMTWEHLNKYGEEHGSSFIVWKSKLIPRDFEYLADNKNSHFSQFLLNVSNQDEERYDGLRSLIGYLMNTHFLKSKGQAGILNDEEITDGTPEGRTGKGLVVNGIAQMKTTVKIDGKKFNNENQFKFSLVKPDTDIVWIDDVKASFDIQALFSDLTDGVTVEEKGKNMYVIPAAESPKFVITSNTAIGGRGKSEIARQYAYELNNFYSKRIIRGNEEPITDYHGGEFFGEDWDELEWNRFYSFMVDNAIFYLSGGIRVPKTVNMELNRLIKNTSGDFVNWANSVEFVFSPARNATAELFDEFKEASDPGNWFNQKTFSAWMKLYAAFNGWRYESGASHGKTYFSLFGMDSRPKIEEPEKEPVIEIEEDIF